MASTRNGTRSLLVGIGSVLLVLGGAAAIALPAFFGSGVGDDDLPGYKFPLRSDPIVVVPPASNASRHVPSEIERVLRGYAESGGTVYDPVELPEDTRTSIAAALDDAFGTPSEPKLPGSDSDELKEGGRRYRLSCAFCHGLTGHGLGPTGIESDPHPRDFRLGKFKRVTGAGHATGRPRRSDLESVLKYGLPGVPGMGPTGLKDADIRKLVSYVVFLSIRGEVELALLKSHLDPEDAPPNDAKAFISERTAKCIEAWKKADEPNPWSIPLRDRPERPTPELQDSIRRGAALFHSSAAGCAGCHEAYGSTPRFRYDAWGHPHRVRNLTEKDRLWSREPLDVARQIRFGIPAANMPAHPSLSDADLADLVDLLRELPFPERLPADVTP